MGFFLTAFLYLILKELRTSKPGPIHIQLCLCLGIAYLIFLSGSDMVHNSLLCIGMAASMHYFLLAAWVWMFVEGLAMFKTLVKKSRFLGNDFLLKWSIVAYVLPACTVAVTMGITIGVLDKEREWYLDPDNTAIVESNYVHDNFCWLHGSALILGFLAKLGFIFAVNVIIYGAVIRSITWGRKKIQSSHAPSSTKDHVIKVTSVAALLGVTWIFSIPLFQTRDETTIIVFSYIFSFFNSFQGVAIFFLFRNPKTRALWLNPIKSKMKYLELTKRRSYMIPSV
ncbi:unnamed protein product [Clavelina lepadiformis]|uniref:G-protein coupled receptors family 2 profile 2 domain-containing protein n=1 Tax=Clavelina lepadiformis TaxID=159417 RepID=A0ABP0EYC2_CLALP